MTACQAQIRTDDRLGVLVPCGKPDAGLVRVSCSRMGHVENLIMCPRCCFAKLYCQQCMDEDQMLVKANVLVVAGSGVEVGRQRLGYAGRA